MPRIVRWIIRIIASLIGLILFVGFVMTALLVYFNSPPAISEESMLKLEGEDISVIHGDIMPNAVRFEIRKGESAQSVGQRLAAAGLIRGEIFWYLLCRFDKEPVKSGTFRIEIPASQIAIHRVLISGRQILLRVTVPEGFTLKKTARLLENSGICSADDFLAAASDPEIIARYRIPGKTMEGYLYPDTYLFPAEYPAARVVTAMADNFFARIAVIDPSEKMMTIAPDELNRLVILASIVEREYRRDEEAPLMAGVFFNRLRIGMALQSCATAEYVITEIQGRDHPGFLSTRDTEIRDPYNTYVYPGLPPGPISAPGAVALRAVLNPQPSGYLYFRLIDPDSGKHYFSETLDAHIKAGTLYVKGGFN